MSAFRVVSKQSTISVFLEVIFVSLSALTEESGSVLCSDAGIQDTSDLECFVSFTEKDLSCGRESVSPCRFVTLPLCVCVCLFTEPLQCVNVCLMVI